MALVRCRECGKDISNQAAACPNCGCPVSRSHPFTRSAKGNPKHYGCGTLIVGIIMVWAVASCWRSATSDAPSPPPPPAPKAADQPENQGVRQRAVKEIRKLAPVSSVEWVDGDLTIAVAPVGNGWESVADSACTWLRTGGFVGQTHVVVLDAVALRNKRWKQLARVTCG